MEDKTISEIVFKQLKSTPENTRCFDCGKWFSNYFDHYSNLSLMNIKP